MIPVQVVDRNGSLISYETKDYLPNNNFVFVTLLRYDIF